MLANEKPTVFISYAHADGYEIAQSIAVALEVYADVFWDKKFEAGDLPEQIRRQIESREFFIQIMTDVSLRRSYWCAKELSHAQETNRKISFVRPANGLKDIPGWVVDDYVYADFTDSFENGFQRLTHLISGSPLLPWMHLSKMNNTELLNSLQRGHVPSWIAREIAEWVILNKMWAFISNYMEEYSNGMHTPMPSTLEGTLTLSKRFLSTFAKYLNGIGSFMILQYQGGMKPLIIRMNELPDSSHDEVCEVAWEIIMWTYRELKLSFIGRMDANGVIYMERYFLFEVAEKLRQYIATHARRSGYLYYSQ